MLKEGPGKKEHGRGKMLEEGPGQRETWSREDAEGDRKMRDLLGDVRREREMQIKLRKKFVDGLRNVTPGHLVKKSKYYYWRRVENGIVVEKYLGADENNPVVKRLKRKKYFQETVRIIDRNIKALEKFEREYRPYDPESVASRVGNAYKVPPDSIFSVMELINPRKWCRKTDNSDLHPEQITQVTGRGEKVRSKSEVIISNALSANNITFRYESWLKVGDEWMRPDFEILLTRGNRLVIWEHFGLADDPLYLEKALRKIKTYIDNGYVLWVNLIVTFEDRRGNLDASLIERIIMTCLL